jgi:hypothetical protein
MNSVPSFTVNVETAATLREWLFENAVEKHGESDISEPLAELAAAIDGELHEQAESIELGASARTFPPANQDASLDAHSPAVDRRSEDGDSTAEPNGFAKDTEPDRIYDVLPDSAWQLDNDQFSTNRENSPTTASPNSGTAASGPQTRQQRNRPSVRYRTTYECAVCGGMRELETTLRVDAFVDECATCGTVARFTTIEIPTPIQDG